MVLFLTAVFNQGTAFHLCLVLFPELSTMIVGFLYLSFECMC